MSDPTIPQVVAHPKNPRFIDLSGQRFGRLTVIGYVGSRTGYALWLCNCECGSQTVAVGKDLRAGKTVSCGCQRSDRMRELGLTNLRHGMTDTPEWRAWKGMLERCYLESYEQFHNYGGRGIAVCDRWRESFENFFADMGTRPGPKYSLDRIDNNGNYEPGNCRWATPAQQLHNQRRTVMLTHDGITLPLVEWAEKVGIAPETIRRRVLTRGWTVERALTTPTNSQ